VTTVALAMVLAGLTIGLASASIPNSSTKVFVACMNSLGQIRMIDHQAGKRCRTGEKTLQWNQRGPTGAMGPPGPIGSPGPSGSVGETGDQGPAGVSGYEVVTDDFVMTLGVVSGTSTVECPDGKVAIGGGYDYSDLFTKFVEAKWENFIGASYPDGSGWTVKWFHNMDNLAINFSVYAVCATAS
jgi:hypothetical protein